MVVQIKKFITIKNNSRIIALKKIIIIIKFIFLKYEIIFNKVNACEIVWWCMYTKDVYIYIGVRLVIRY